MELESKVSFEIKQTLTRTSLSRALGTLEAAAVPADASLNIIAFSNGLGFAVKATWKTNTEEDK